MRKEPTDIYKNIFLLGNNIYDILFVNYLFESQNINSNYCDKYIIEDKRKGNIIRNMAYYFGTNELLLINDEILKEIFVKYGIPESYEMPVLNSTDIINIIDNCINSDAVYVCNSNGFIDNNTMFILGYLMAKKQEIFFWNDIDKSEWLMSLICKKNDNGYKEFI